MSLPTKSLSSLLLLAILFAFPITGLSLSSSKKLDEADPSIKCGGCSPCGSAQCYLSPPPPPPVQSPPPPAPPKNPPSTAYCPPPPASPYIYMTAPPGNLYPVDPYLSGSTRISPAVFGCWLLGLLVLWL